MPDIEHELTVAAPVAHVFDSFATADGLAAWWPDTAAAEPREGGRFEFGFGPEYQWAGVARVFQAPRAIEWEMTETDPMPDWTGTRVGVRLEPVEGGTRVHFYHRGWAEPSAHYRISSFCWSNYLRVLARNRTTGEFVPYSRRDDL
ncbi:MAG: SRPBCC domain-containing protein [Gemmatimonadales bacterium]